MAYANHRFIPTPRPPRPLASFLSLALTRAYTCAHAQSFNRPVAVRFEKPLAVSLGYTLYFCLEVGQHLLPL